MSESVPRIVPRRMRIAAPSGPLQASEVALGTNARGAVLLLGAPDIGVDVDSLLNELALHGYASLAVDLRPADDDLLLADARALLDELGERGWAPDERAVVGHGLGGRAALLISRDHFGAAVSVLATPAAGPASALQQAVDEVCTPWLGLFGDVGTVPAPAAIDALRERARAQARAHVQVVHYPGVGRALYRDGSGGAEHAAHFDAWQRTLEWLDLRVAHHPTELARQHERRLSRQSIR